MIQLRLHASEEGLNIVFVDIPAKCTTREFTEDKYSFGVRLGDAYVLAHQWQNAVIIANNIPDPNLQASILFRVLAESPQHVPPFNLPILFEEFADCRWASYGMAGYVEHRLRSGDEAIDVLEWIRKLENPALRGAAYTGIARSVDVFSITSNPELVPMRDVTKPDVSNLRSLVEYAQGTVVGLDSPLEAAYGWLEVARTWRLIQREKSYQDATLSFHDCCFAEWLEIWKQPPPASRGYDGSYHDEYSRRQAVEQDEIARLIECERHLAELQVELEDTDGALYTCLRIANHAGFIDMPADYVDWQFIFVECILKRIQSKTGVGPEVLLPRRAFRTPYIEAMALAWSSESSRFQTQIEQMRVKEKADKIARASAELAILFAKQGDLDRYRVARRGAFSEINRSSNSRFRGGFAASAIKFIIAAACAPSSHRYKLIASPASSLLLALSVSSLGCVGFSQRGGGSFRTFLLDRNAPRFHGLQNLLK